MRFTGFLIASVAVCMTLALAQTSDEPQATGDSQTTGDLKPVVNTWAFTTAKAKEAKARYDLTITTLDEKYKGDVLSAKEKLAKELTEAGTLAIKAENLDEAIRIRTAIQELHDDKTIPNKTIPNKRIPKDAVRWNEHYYKVFTDPVMIDVANRRCEALGGHLVRIRSQQQHQFVVSLIRNSTLRGFWIDGADSETQGTYRFGDGSPMKYFHWVQGDPNHFNGAEYWLCLHKESGWNWVDEPAHWRVGYICEWE